MTRNPAAQRLEDRRFSLTSGLCPYRGSGCSLLRPYLAKATARYCQTPRFGAQQKSSVTLSGLLGRPFLIGMEHHEQADAQVFARNPRARLAGFWTIQGRTTVRIQGSTRAAGPRPGRPSRRDVPRGAILSVSSKIDCALEAVERLGQEDRGRSGRPRGYHARDGQEDEGTETCEPRAEAGQRDPWKGVRTFYAGEA